MFFHGTKPYMYCMNHRSFITLYLFHTMHLTKKKKKKQCLQALEFTEDIRSSVARELVNTKALLKLRCLVHRNIPAGNDNSLLPIPSRVVCHGLGMCGDVLWSQLWQLVGLCVNPTQRLHLLHAQKNQLQILGFRILRGR